MWLHGIGWLLPTAIEIGMLYVVRSGTLHHASFLKICKEPPLALGRDRCFRHVLLSAGPSPMVAGQYPRSTRGKHQPPTGLQLWPGHSLQLHLRVPWKSAYRPLPSHWPMKWSAHIRTWHLHHCPHKQFQWRTSPWRYAPPAVFGPTHVRYHTRSGHAEWTFELKER